MFLLILFIPTISYSQYPKQTIINGDTVVVMLKSQADVMNKTFVKQDSVIVSYRLNIDTIESLYVSKKIQHTNDSIMLIQYKSQEQYCNNQQKEPTIFISFLLFIAFIGSVLITSQ